MTKFYPVVGNMPSLPTNHVRDHHAKATGEFRAPKKGEWYLSGAIVEAYQAPINLSTPYHIAVVVKTHTRTIIEEVTD